MLHPEARAGIQHRPKPLATHECPHRRQELRTDVTVIKVVFGAHDQFSTNHLVNKTILRQGRQFRFGPNLLGSFHCNIHERNLAPRNARVKLMNAGTECVSTPFPVIINLQPSTINSQLSLFAPLSQVRVLMSNRSVKTRSPARAAANCSPLQVPSAGDGFTSSDDVPVPVTTNKNNQTQPILILK